MKMSTTLRGVRKVNSLDSITHTFIFSDNTVIVKELPINEEVMFQIGTTTIDDLDILFPEVIEVVKTINQVAEESIKTYVSVDTLDDRFYEEDGALFIKGLPYSSETMRVKLKENVGKPLFEALVKFWFWVCCSKHEKIRKNLYTWIEDNETPLTPNGELVLGRRANKIESELNHGSLNIHTYIKETYEKRKQGKKSTNVLVYLVNEKEFSLMEKQESQVLGNLKELYSTIEKKKEVYYQSVTSCDLTNEKRIFKIGEITHESNVDYSDRDCGAGLHAGNKCYNFNGYGDTSIAVIINPAHLVNCMPNQNKLRSSALMVLTELESDCEIPHIDGIVDTDFKVIDFENVSNVLNTVNINSNETVYKNQVINPTTFQEEFEKYIHHKFKSVTKNTLVKVG